MPRRRASLRPQPTQTRPITDPDEGAFRAHNKILIMCHAESGDPQHAPAWHPAFYYLCWLHGPYAHNSTFDSNETAYNGGDQKLGETTNVTFRNNSSITTRARYLVQQQQYRRARRRQSRGG